MTTKFVGWAKRKRERWRALSEGATESEASKKLMAVVSSWLHVDVAVLPAGTDPGRRTKRPNAAGAKPDGKKRE